MKDPLIVVVDSQNPSFFVDVLMKLCFRVVKTTPTELKQKLGVGVESSIVAVELGGGPQQILCSLKHDDTKSPIPPLVIIHTERSAECAELWADLSIQKEFLLFFFDPAKLHDEILNVLLEIHKRCIQSRRSSLQNATVRNAIIFISENLQHPISSRDVANHVCLSRNHFAEQFKRATGLTPSSFINRLRIQMAKKLIIENLHWSFTTVAEHCGFSDVYYFSRIFKNYTSQSPRDFKQAACRALDELSATGVIRGAGDIDAFYNCIDVTDRPNGATHDRGLMPGLKSKSNCSMVFWERNSARRVRVLNFFCSRRAISSWMSSARNSG